MVNGKSVFTTGDVAKICNVAPRTVSKWFDAGHLRGYRIPGSKDRRIPLDLLIHFMRQHGIPLNGLEGDATRVLLLDADQQLCETIKNTIAAHGYYDLETAHTAFEAGLAANEFKPHVFVVDVSLADIDSSTLRRQLQCNDDLATTKLVGMSTSLTPGCGQTLLQRGFDAYLTKPFDLSSLVEVLENVYGAATPVEIK